MKPVFEPLGEKSPPITPRNGAGLAAIPLYVGFAATGVGVALPGALLPALLQHWNFHDEQAGRLFLMAFAGSSVGALLVRRSLRMSLFFGTMAIAAGSLCLAFCSARTAYASIAPYGLGLGLTMTSISLIRQRQSGGSGTVLVRLNLLWAVGAFVCPSLMTAALRTADIRPPLICLSACFVLLMAWTILQHDLPAGPGATELRPWAIFRAVPISLILMTLLVPGIEASAGGWLATYARRGGHSIAETVAAPTCFWAGLLLSRLFWSICDRWCSDQWTVRASVILMTAASVLLISSDGGFLILSAAFCLGFGIGPVYPLLLAMVLRFRGSGTIFFLAGLGSSCLPWLTGVVSGQRHSLRLGLAVPMAATILLTVMSLLRRSRSTECW